MAPRNTLEPHEIALIKAFFRFTSMNNQEVLSYFSRPGRSLNHRVISEIRHEEQFRDVNPATAAELRAFQAQWRRPEVVSTRVTDGQRRIAALLQARSRSDARNEYWIGAGVDYGEIWSAYESGLGYIDKFRSIPAYILEIEFASSNYRDPLFDHEAIFKTLKGLFHDLKKENLSVEEFNASGPMFLYSVERGSSIYRIMAGLRELLMQGMTLTEQKIMKSHLENKQRRIDFIKKNFPDVDEEGARKFIMARTTYEMDEGLERLMERGIKSVKISVKPVAYDPTIPIAHRLDTKNLRMIELKQQPEEPHPNKKRIRPAR